MSTPPPVDPERFLADLRALRAFGGEGRGVHRPAYSEEDRAARNWLRERMLEAGLEARIDGVGNVVGNTTGTGPALVLASHSDTVPHGGWLDGAYGVVAALEVARATQSTGTPLALEVISFADEEGAFHGTLGSSVYCGLLGPADLAEMRDPDGRVWSEQVNACGWADEELVRLDPKRHRGYLEIHIEQGPSLETEGLDIGVVTGIVGMRRQRIVFTGRADHAGATPMADRRDAGAAALRCGAEILDLFESSSGTDTVWNIGTIRLEPGASNVVPAHAEFTIEYRDTDDAYLERMDARIPELVGDHAERSGCTGEWSFTVHAPPVPMANTMMDLVEEAAKLTGLRSRRMPSAAGHDAMNVARFVPTGMIFVPSIEGRSHQPGEDTSEHDLVNGLQVLAIAAAMA